MPEICNVDLKQVALIGKMLVLNWARPPPQAKLLEAEEWCVQRGLLDKTKNKLLPRGTFFASAWSRNSLDASSTCWR